MLQDQTGYLSSDLVYKVFSTLRITTDRNNLEKLLKRMNILTIDNRICYLKFADVINIHSPLSDLGMVNGSNMFHFISIKNGLFYLIIKVHKN